MKGQNFSFMKEMVPMIISGRKIITNRIATPFRQKLDVGGIMHLFTGMRTANCKKIGTAKLIDKGIWNNSALRFLDEERAARMWLDICPYMTKHKWNFTDFSYRDGFDNWNDFNLYFSNKRYDVGIICYLFEFSIERLI